MIYKRTQLSTGKNAQLGSNYDLAEKFYTFFVRAECIWSRRVEKEMCVCVFGFGGT